MYSTLTATTEALIDSGLWLVMFDGLCGLEIPGNTKSAMGRKLRFISTYEPTRVMLLPDSFDLLSLRMWSGNRCFSRVCVNLRRYSSLCKRKYLTTFQLVHTETT